MNSSLSLRISFLLALFAMMSPAGRLRAQCVTVGPATGNLIAAVTGQSEVGFAAGYSAMWMHEQLPLTLITADEPTLTTDGLLSRHACNLIRSPHHPEAITIAATQNAYFCLSLPRGYRFSSYDLVLQDAYKQGDKVNGKSSDLSVRRNGWRFSETDASFSVDIAEAGMPITVGAYSQPDASRDYQLRRTGQLGRVLYFRLQGGGSGYMAAMVIKSLKITFEADDSFSIGLAPSETTAEGVSVLGVPFATGRLDIGMLNHNEKDGVRYYSYVYSDVKDLHANMLLYSQDAVRDGRTDDSAGSRGIFALAVGSYPSSGEESQHTQNIWLGLRRGTYFIETPTVAMADGGVEVPVGYRITGARIICKKNADYSGSGDFVLTLYDKNGIDVAHQTSASDEAAEMLLSGLNNDAIRLQIDAADDSVMALVRIELTLQALNPYIQSYQVNAITLGDEQRVAQHFLADDFCCGGADAVFAVPEGFASEQIAITFDQLSSKHADDTYCDATLDLSASGHSRYHFVRSEYYDLTAASPYDHPFEVASYDFRRKVEVKVAGNNPFRFNNAADLSNDNEAAAPDYLRLYPFSPEAYAAEGGAFNELYLSNEDIDREHIVYLFTRDETRYNIAPTWATRHEAHAFYECNILLKSKDYTPRLDYTTIYANTYRSDERINDDKPFIGVTVGVSEDLSSQLTRGFLTARQIEEKLMADISAGLAGAPVDLSHVLYIDASGLNSVIQGGNDFGSISATLASLAPNAIYYLPGGTTVLADNCATLRNTVDGTKQFAATRNIVVTDKEPFYAPYQIQVDDTHMATYRRMMTNSRYGRNEFATICLPFTLKGLTDGIHESRYGRMHLLRMNSSDAVARGSDFTYDATLFFNTATEATTARANTPYAVRIEENRVEEDYIHFIIEQNGALVEATPSTEQLFGSEVSTGSIIDNASVSGGGADASSGSDSSGSGSGVTTLQFTHRATFAGVQLDKTAQPTFYFGSRGFVSSLDLNAQYRKVNVFPFRSVYEYTQEGQAKLQLLGVTIGDNDEAGVTTGITSIASGASDGSIVAGKGIIRIVAPADGDYSVRNLRGELLRQFSLKRDDRRSIALPRGIYLVGNKKVVVK